MKKQSIISFFCNFGIVFLFFLCMTGSIIGVPSWPGVETAIGNFIVSTNPYGIALYQQDKHASLQCNGFDQFTITNKMITITSMTSLNQDIAYSRDDIIFDASGNLYTEPPQEEQDYINKILSIPLVKIDAVKRVAPLYASRIFILNPQISGILDIQLPNDMQINIDRETKRILFGNRVGLITVTVHDSIEEINMDKNI